MIYFHSHMVVRTWWTWAFLAARPSLFAVKRFLRLPGKFLGAQFFPKLNVVITMPVANATFTKELLTIKLGLF